MASVSEMQTGAPPPEQAKRTGPSSPGHVSTQPDAQDTASAAQVGARGGSVAGSHVGPPASSSAIGAGRPSPHAARTIATHIAAIVLPIPPA